MSKTLIQPPGSEVAVRQACMSPGIMAGPLLFVTGMTGSGPDGTMPDDPTTQFRAAFDKIGTVLHEAGLDFEQVVEMTSYHIGLRAHFDLFDKVRLDYLPAPLPAWTAVEVAGLRRPGALVEIRVIASKDA